MSVFQDFAPTKQVSSCIVCCAPASDNPWMQLAKELPRKHRQWYFFTDQPRGLLERRIPHSSLSALRASWQAIQAVKQHQADLLVTGDRQLSLWCAVFAALQNVKVYHIVYSFHFPRLPGGILGWLMQSAFPTLYQFTVHSRDEKRLYGDYFGIPQSRFEMIHWGITLPTLPPDPPLIRGEYICAVSGQGQGLPTLMSAMEKLSHIRLVLIGKPENLKWLKIPVNVTIWPDASQEAILNILHHARFVVSPVKNSQTRCDYPTLVTAMHLGKTFVVMQSLGASDYAFDRANAVVCEPSNPSAFTAAIRKLWRDPEQCKKLGDNGKEFATAFCSGRSIQKYLQNLLVRKGF